MSGLLALWLTPDLLEGISARSWPVAEGRLLHVGKGVWAEGGEYSFISRMPIGRYSGDYYGVSILYHYLAPGPKGEKTPYTGWRYDAASSSGAFLSLPALTQRGSRWEGVHPGAPFTYAAIAHSLPAGAAFPSVRYNPDDPARSLLKPGIATDTAFFLILFCAFSITATGLWPLALNPLRVEDTSFQGTTAARAILFGAMALLYPPVSLPLGVFFKSVIPTGYLLAYAVLGLIWVFFPRLYQPVLGYKLIAASLNALGRVVVLSGILISLYGLSAGLFGWKIYGDIVPSYQPGREAALEALAGDDPYLYPWAIYRLTESGSDPSHIPILLSKLAIGSGGEEGTTAAVLYALKKLGPAATEALPAVIGLLPQYEEAVYTLREIEPGPVEAIPALTVLLDSERWDIRTAAMQMLGNCGPKAGAAVPKLEAALESTDFRVRMGALGSLGQIGASGAIPKITEALGDQKAEVRQRALAALKTFGPEAIMAVPAIERLLDGDDEIWVRKEAAEALKRIR